MAKILAVDDDNAILDMIGNILSRDGHQVIKTDNPQKLNMEQLSVIKIHYAGFGFAD